MLTQGGIQYERVVYGYGEGANPDACGGTGYSPKGGPIALTGHKMLPVLQGPDLPALKEGYKGMPESMEIAAFLMGRHGVALPCDPGRDDLGAWHKTFKPVLSLLSRPRNIQMKNADWAAPQDVAYAKWKYSTRFGFDYEDAVARTPQLVEEMSALLIELDGLLRGDDCLNSWGVGMDDIKLLPDLRTLSCVKGVVWPPRVKAYVEKHFAKTQAGTYFDQAV